MHIEAELDEAHAQRLQAIQRQLQQSLPDVLATLIDLGQRHIGTPPMEAAEPAPLYAALEQIGFVGCLDADATLAANYKDQLDYSAKDGHPQ
ncbi:hypothetical protein [Halochromatium roseum]|uniref:hypothetical protein n=1 Tax=Halochromatium roseum TaxID=391920 RepID=UPI00191497C3|nr:hypothetical protein [Halochromatium roseum]MBK5941819.1 hypothetical protein [Halochromatium roseum]